MTLPILQPSPTETLADRCARLAAQVAEYEQDGSNQAPLELTDIRAALAAAASVLQS